ncbi:hypothetical protein M0R45_008755 [Rubus argutus]|uniref:Uncharacterized protein n=1 Tax=Rubus argutus TaxID=59490 RepID=A0AAW1Y3V0_RUBAR
MTRRCASIPSESPTKRATRGVRLRRGRRRRDRLREIERQISKAQASKKKKKDRSFSDTPITKFTFLQCFSEEQRLH